MDFHSMSRKELQTLCKSYGIPANKTNVFMADALAAKEKNKKQRTPFSHIDGNSAAKPPVAKKRSDGEVAEKPRPPKEEASAEILFVNNNFLKTKTPRKSLAPPKTAAPPSVAARIAASSSAPEKVACARPCSDGNSNSTACSADSSLSASKSASKSAPFASRQQNTGTAPKPASKPSALGAHYADSARDELADASVYAGTTSERSPQLESHSSSEGMVTPLYFSKRRASGAQKRTPEAETITKGPVGDLAHSATLVPKAEVVCSPLNADLAGSAQEKKFSASFPDGSAFSGQSAAGNSLARSVSSSSEAQSAALSPRIQQAAAAPKLKKPKAEIATPSPVGDVARSSPPEKFGPATNSRRDFQANADSSGAASDRAMDIRERIAERVRSQIDASLCAMATKHEPLPSSLAHCKSGRRAELVAKGEAFPIGGSEQARSPIGVASQAPPAVSSSTATPGRQFTSSELSSPALLSFSPLLQRVEEKFRSVSDRVSRFWGRTD